MESAMSMASVRLKIAGGTVYDPTNGISGEIRDIWVEDGRIVAPPEPAKGA